MKQSKFSVNTIKYYRFNNNNNMIHCDRGI